jgi:hypothetical protein
MLQSKEKISIDIDDTSARTIEDWVYPHVNAIHWTDFTHDTTFNYRNVFADIITKKWVPITLEEKIQLFNWAILLDQWKNKIRPIDWSVEKIKELSQWFDISMLTARHPMLIEYTPEWVQHHFNSSVKNVLFSNCYHGGKKTKSSICIEEWVKIMIEDDIDYSLELAEVWIKVYLLNKPWNIHRKEKHRNIVRVDWWEDIKI